MFQLIINKVFYFNNNNDTRKDKIQDIFDKKINFALKYSSH